MTITDQCLHRLPLMEPRVRWLPDKPRVRGMVPDLIARCINKCCAGESPWPLVMVGDAGSGKTCAALLLSDRASGFYSTARDFVERLRDAEFGRLYSESGYTISKQQLWRDWSTPALAILDELGTRSTVSDHHYDVVKTCLDSREGRPTVYIANLTIERIAEVYDDRVASRLSAGTVVKCRGDMRRHNG